MNNSSGSELSVNWYPFIPIGIFLLAFVMMPGWGELLVGGFCGVFYVSTVTGPKIKRCDELMAQE